MKAIPILLACSLLPGNCFAQAPEGPLVFSARIQEAALAEEAIDLLHCLSDHLNMDWELGEGRQAKWSLNVREGQGKLIGSFHAPDKDTKISLAEGDAGALCDQLAPSAAEKVTEIGSPLPESREPETRSTWIWAVGALAVAAGGFFLWKAGRPDHQSIRME
jgi:hypothetical protein